MEVVRDALTNEVVGGGRRVDMREIAIYRSIDDGSLWARPREEFEDGRFRLMEPSMTDTLDGNGVAAVARIIDPHSFMPDNSGDDLIAEMVKQGRELAISKATRILAYLASVAPSQTAVEPVAWRYCWPQPRQELRWFIYNYPDKPIIPEPEWAVFEPLVPLSALTEQTAAREAAEKERDAALDLIKLSHKAQAVEKEHFRAIKAEARAEAAERRIEELTAQNVAPSTATASLPEICRRKPRPRRSRRSPRPHRPR